VQSTISSFVDSSLAELTGAGVSSSASGSSTGTLGSIIDTLA
jgi:hypothetical protein